MSEEGNKAYALFSKLSSVIEKFSHDGNGIFEQMAADDTKYRYLNLYNYSWG